MRLFLCLPVLLGTAAMMEAGTISYVFSTDTEQKDNWYMTFSVPRFNVPGATLTDITARVEGSARVCLTATNDTGGLATYTYMSSAGVGIAAEGFDPFSSFAWFASFGGSLTEPPGAFTFWSPAVTGSGSFHPMTPSVFFLYTGLGTAPITLGGSYGPDTLAPQPYLIGPHGREPGIHTYSTAQLTVTYTFTDPVPEPGTLGLLGCGLLILGRKLRLAIRYRAL